MDSSDEQALAPRRRPHFSLFIALLMLTLSALYALVFSQLVYGSLLEQHLAPHHERLRFEGPLHLHAPAEWVLLVGPAALGWAGILICLNYLRRRWLS